MRPRANAHHYVLARFRSALLLDARNRPSVRALVIRSRRHHTGSNTRRFRFGPPRRVAHITTQHSRDLGAFSIGTSSGLTGDTGTGVGAAVSAFAFVGVSARGFASAEAGASSRTTSAAFAACAWAASAAASSFALASASALALASASASPSPRGGGGGLQRGVRGGGRAALGADGRARSARIRHSGSFVVSGPAWEHHHRRHHHHHRRTFFLTLLGTHLITTRGCARRRGASRCVTIDRQTDIGTRDEWDYGILHFFMTK